jgi:hypothetical protein
VSRHQCWRRQGEAGSHGQWLETKANSGLVGIGQWWHRKELSIAVWTWGGIVVGVGCDRGCAWCSGVRRSETRPTCAGGVARSEMALVLLVEDHPTIFLAVKIHAMIS